MTRPGPLYDRLGIESGELFDVHVGGTTISERIKSVSIRRGSADLSRLQPATCTIETTANVTEIAGAQVVATLAPNVAASIADPTNPGSYLDIFDRWSGRLASSVMHDSHTGLKGTRLTSSAWSAVLRQAQETWDPNGADFKDGLSTLGQPPWGAIIPLPIWVGDSDAWPPAPPEGEPLEPITAAQWLAMLESRLYGITDRRDGPLQIRSLTAWEALAEAAAADTEPLTREHCIAPTTWERPVEWPTSYLLRRTLQDGSTTAYTYGLSTNKVEELDWRDTISKTEQYRRVDGLRHAASSWPWQLPRLRVPIDHLIASGNDAHRRAAARVLGLEVGDPVPLAADWPFAVRGIHLCTGLTETITPTGWTIDLQLAPYRLLAGNRSPAIRPRTWGQADTATWADPANRTWNEGPAA